MSYAIVTICAVVIFYVTLKVFGVKTERDDIEDWW